MSENKCCGNCKHFKNEDAEGYGWSDKLKQTTHCSFKCYHHEFKNNGWIEITPDNVDAIYDEVLARVIVTDGKEYKTALDWHLSLGTMAKFGGYWYYQLPELKIKEESE